MTSKLCYIELSCLDLQKPFFTWPDLGNESNRKMIITIVNISHSEWLTLNRHHRIIVYFCLFLLFWRSFYRPTNFGSVRKMTTIRNDPNIPNFVLNLPPRPTVFLTQGCIIQVLCIPVAVHNHLHLHLLAASCLLCSCHFFQHLLCQPTSNASFNP